MTRKKMEEISPIVEFLSIEEKTVLKLYNINPPLSPSSSYEVKVDLRPKAKVLFLTFREVSSESSGKKHPLGWKEDEKGRKYGLIVLEKFPGFPSGLKRGEWITPETLQVCF